MSTDLYLTNDEKENHINKDCSHDEIEYLNRRLVYLEKVIKSKYSDILYLTSEISNLKNINLKYDLIDILIKHGSNLSRYKSELVDVKDMMDFHGRNANKPRDTVQDDSVIVDNDIKNKKPHNFDLNKENENDADSSAAHSATTDTDNDADDTNNVSVDNTKDDAKSQLDSDVKLKNVRIVTELNSEPKNKAELARERIITNLDRLISYKENTFNDLIEMVDFHINFSSQKIDLSRFIESLENQIVELNEYKNNILKNHSLSKSIEIGSGGKITFSRMFIEKERLIDKNKEEYIKVLSEMHDLYSSFVDNYLKNINFMKPHLAPEKINSMQSNCGKVIYDLKLIRNLYSSLDKLKGV